MQMELDELKRENFALRNRVEGKEEEASTLTNLLSSAETQIEELYDALKKLVWNRRVV